MPVIGLPCLQMLAPAGAFHRDKTVIGSIYLADDSPGNQRERGHFTPGLRRGDREIWDGRNVVNFSVKLSETFGCDIENAFHIQAEMIDQIHCPESAADIFDAPVGPWRAAMWRANGDERPDVLGHVQAA